ncbi:MAG TPA: isoamylase early set domain-containing protein [Phycisphaerae bacterium]|nr:isoamylase early set domain-containing protein [Phycisphaerae bacterium]HRY70392.1 isoamylase early set domain-containing protein [Phycisphaerae bacterium]HSA28109.1 isoamylase early set domain-containing protein [Phycisphaerae bacterium]
MVCQVSGGEIEFRFFRPEANQVLLVGDFNGWSSAGFPMARLENGEWTCRLTLPEGSYQFKYLADGEWFLDYAAFGLEHGPYGMNSVVMVTSKPASLPKTKCQPPARKVRRPASASRRLAQPAA